MYKVFIRPLKVEDALISYKWRNDEEVWKYTGSKPDKEITFDIENEWIKKVIVEEDSQRFAIIADDVYVGNIQLTNIDSTSAEYHIFIGDKNWWGKGISHLATFQLLYYAKEQLNLYHIYLSVRTGNEAAIKSYLKSQFVIESSDEDWLKMICNLSSVTVPTISVFVMVYNHEKYLTECLEGILMQKCGFNYDIVVGEDCSTDNSRAILLDYGKKYPGKFKLLLHDKNIGAVKNQNAVFKACVGKYIAMCEGDDYWTDPLKLQKQIDFLEENHGTVACQHNRWFKDGEKMIPHTSGKYIYTQCLVFKNILNEGYFTYMINNKVFNGDTFLENFLKLNGEYYHLDFFGAVYRFHRNGVYSSLQQEDKVLKSLNTSHSILNFINVSSENYINSGKIRAANKAEIISSLYFLGLHKSAGYDMQDYFRSLIEFKNITFLDFKRIFHYIKVRFL